MLMSKRSWRFVLYFVAAAACVYIILVLCGRVPFAEVCSKGKYGPPDNCSYHDIVLAWVLWLFVFADEHNGLVGALAGLAVAFFTGSLWFVTNKGLNLARDEFNATHRPRIEVLGLFLNFAKTDKEGNSVPDNAGTSLEGFVRFVNSGAAPARITEIGSTLTLNPNAEPEFSNAIFDSFVLESGIETTHCITTGGLLKFKSEFGKPTHCVGYIAYLDSAKRRRKIGFCYLLDSNGFRWVRDKESPYDHAY